MHVNITIVTYNRLNLTELCLASLLDRTRGSFTVQVVDNRSTDGTRDFLDRLAAKDARVRPHFLDRNMGVAVAANYGWALLDAPYYLKLDNDMLVQDPGWLEKLLHVLEENPDVGLAGYQILGRQKTSPVSLAGGVPFRLADFCGGACVLVPRRVHERLGFWNEDYGKYGFEDLDYGNRAVLAGFRIGYPDDDASVRHLGYEVPDRLYEGEKKKSVTSARSGEKLFVLNKLMFENAVRPLYVDRKHLPEISGRRVVFRTNPGYGAIVRMQRDLLAKTGYTVEGERIALNLVQWKSAGEA
jgi:GT2 family glycosyltransferase